MATQQTDRYVLGIDLGSASLGWAMVALDDRGEPNRLLRTGVRIFDPGVSGTELEILQGKDESKNVKRRQMRLQRRQLRRRAARQRDLFELLQQHGLLPPYEKPISDAVPHVTNAQRSVQRHEILKELDNQLFAQFEERMKQEVSAADHVLPYYLRSLALRERLEPFALGRVLYHLSQRRGFLSNRRDLAKTKDKQEEKSKVYAGISEISKEMRESGAPSLGYFFAHQNPEEKRIRGRWTARTMYLSEFEAIWQAQSAHHPQTLTPQLKTEINRLLFFQRPIAAQKHLVGECELEPGRKRAPIYSLDAQRFRLLQKVNDLRISDANFNERRLTREERNQLLAVLEHQGEISFSALRTLLRLPKRGIWFNLERGGEKKIPGNRTACKMRAAFGQRWGSFTKDEKDKIVEEWAGAETEEWLLRRGMNKWGLDEEHARLWAQAEPEDGFARLSHKAIQKILPMMEDGLSFKEAEKEAYGVRFSGGAVLDALPPVRKAIPSLRNPAVERSLTELRKVVNAILREHGKPYEIHIELARDVKNPRADRKEIWTAMRDRQKRRETVVEKVLKEGGIPHPTGLQIEKALLAEECRWECPYTGRKIRFAELFGDEPQFDIEHILPFSRCPDNSFANKTLCYLPENRDVKRNQTPFEAYGSDAERWEQVLHRVRQFKNNGKLRRFQVKTREELEQFNSRQLNDTRYSSKLAAEYLGCLYGGRDLARPDGSARRVIHASAGKLTADLRRNWGLEAILREPEPAASEEKKAKPRSDHRHHAIDAMVIALTSPAAVKMLADAAERNLQRGRASLKGTKVPWNDFVESIRPHIESLVVSHRPEHKLTGQLHDETLYGHPHEREKKSFVHVRKPVEALTKGELEEIVDPKVREAVSARMKELGDLKKLQTAGVEPPCLRTKDGRKIPIRRVRVRKALTVQPVGKGPRRRHVAPNNNHHMEIVAQLDERGNEIRWDGVPVSLLEAMQRRREGKPIVQRHHGKGFAFKCSLMGGDTIEVTEDGATQIYVVRTIATNGQIALAKVTDARLIKEIKEAGDWWSPRADALRKLSGRKVVIDVLGRVHPAND
jgi:CRISPR-associated endonuclease Csn1